jgi:hypothetical protein
MRTFRRVTLLLLLLALPVSLSAAAAAAQTKGLDKTPQVKAYQTLLKAVAAQDFEAYKKAMTKEAGKAMDQQTKEMGLDPKKGMEFLKAMSPAELKYTSLKVDGKKATLMAAGKIGGEMNTGTIELAEEDGQWKVGKQSWTNVK